MKNVITFSFLLSMVLAFNTSAQSLSTFINEINYTASNPTEAGLEIAGEAGSDLEGWSVVGYALDGTVEYVEYLSGIIPNQQNGKGTFWYDVEQNSGGGGLALVNVGGNVVQFLSFGTVNFVNVIITATEGPANGMASSYVGTQILPENPLQLTGTGLSYTDFIWSIPEGATQGSVNTNQLFSIPPVFLEYTINSITSNSESIDYRFKSQQNDELFDVNVYPNPTAGQVQINFRNEHIGKAEVYLFDQTSRVVYQQSLTDNTSGVQFDLTDLTPGYYNILIESRGAKSAKRVLKK